MKVGIITFQWSRNYGAALQTFALTHYLKAIGIDVQVVNYKPSYPKKEASFSSKMKDKILSLLLIPDKKNINNQIARFDKFRSEFFSLTKPCVDTNDIATLDLDCYICGSDQIWNPSLTGGKLDPVYFAAFETTGRKVAYAASIGEKNVRDCDKETFIKFLEGFHSVSVREAQIVEIIEEFSIVPVENVLDPTLLLNQHDYSAIAEERIVEEPYLLIYQNTRNNYIYEVARKVASAKELRIIELGYRRQFPSTGVDIIESAGPKEFLSLYQYADYIVTNTFHGTVFAVQFEKDFISIPLTGRESRVENLTNKLGLMDRLLYEEDDSKVSDIICNNIDYKNVKSLLSKEQGISRAFLQKAVSG
jgi:hypothetical protein